VIAAFASGDLLVEERDAVERHLARCETCRSIAAAVAAEVGARAEDAPIPAARGSAPWWTPARVAAAAVVLVAVGVALAFALKRPSAPPTTDEVLVATAKDLARAHPGLFEGFSPLSEQERRADGRDRHRGTGELALLEPAGKVLETRPRLRWEGDHGAERWVVVVARADGTVVLRAEPSGPSLEWPKDAADLEPGVAYQWTVTGTWPGGEEKARGVFEVASAEDGSAFEAAVRAIDAGAPAKVRRLLEAHLAFRRGYLARAVEAARAAVAEAPGDAAAVETLALVERATGARGD
jgi:hypothetical protein